MARKTAVELHPKNKEIERRLAKGDSINSISGAYGISRGALSRHKESRLPQKLINAVQKRDITSAEELFQIILGTVRKIEKLSESCDAYLQDPDDPNLYYMGPRAHEVDIVWEEEIETSDGSCIYKKHRDTLQDLIDTYFRGGEIVKMKSSHTDPRILLVKSSDTLTKQMDTLVQAWKSVDQGSSAFIGTESWNQAVKTILRVTEPYPEIRREMAIELSKLSD